MDITKLPIGMYADGSPVFMSLESRNALINGNPRSGKSVCLSALICSLLRCDNEHVIIMSPKILDFQRFAPAVELIKDADVMLERLKALKEESEARKLYCEQKFLKKIEPSLYSVYPHITVIVDEFTVIKKSTKADDKGKTIKIGEQIEAEIMKLIAETGFAAFSFVLSTQRVSSTNMSTDIRDIVSGNRISFATSTPETDRMIFGEYATYAPCYEINRYQVGCGYISVDDAIPVPFKGAFATEQDEDQAVRYAVDRQGR